MKKILGKKTEIRKKKRLSVRMPQSMIADIETQLKKEGLSIKQRSNWIANSIIELSKSECFEDLIAEEWIEPGGNIVVQITVDDECKKILEDIEHTINKTLSSKDIISSIVRTAIIYKLIP